MSVLVPINRISRVLRVGLMAIIALYLVEAGYAVIVLDLLVDLERGISDPVQAQLVTDLADPIRFSLTGAVLLCGLLFLVWFHRAYGNLAALGRSPKSSVRWSVVWFFVPVANWVKPYSMMREVVDACPVDVQATSRLVGLWWFCWLVNSGLGRWTSHLEKEAEATAQYIELIQIELVRSGVLVVAIVLLTMVVGTIARHQTTTEVDRRLAAVFD